MSHVGEVARTVQSTSRERWLHIQTWIDEIPGPIPYALPQHTLLQAHHNLPSDLVFDIVRSLPELPTRSRTQRRRSFYHQHSLWRHPQEQEAPLAPVSHPTTISRALLCRLGCRAANRSVGSPVSSCQLECWPQPSVVWDHKRQVKIALTKLSNQLQESPGFQGVRVRR